MHETAPVTASSPPGGRPRSRKVPDTAFNTWLGAQKSSVVQIAQQLGLSRWAVYHLRNGYHRPSLDVAHRIAELSGGAVPTTSWPVPKRRQPRKRTKS